MHRGKLSRLRRLAAAFEVTGTALAVLALLLLAMGNRPFGVPAACLWLAVYFARFCLDRRMIHAITKGTDDHG